MKNAIFTICAKNYLAQALSLKESTLKHNKVDFYIYLSDNKEGLPMQDVISLNDSWIPHWKKMAFKYNVIEFSTSIKPFCIDHLFKKGYRKVIYLDPDIFVFNSLDYVFDSLETKSIILTPHRCIPSTNNTEYINEEAVSNVGIYNLGFIGIKNNNIGEKLINWWKDKLRDKCYIDKKNGLFVDQKWIDFIPGYFPNDILISQHLGLNVATWNLQERNIIFKENNIYIRNKVDTNEIFPLIFFHFSGYSPNIPYQLDKRIHECNINTIPSLKPLIDEYKTVILKNGYNYYSLLKYSFNTFDDNTKILDLNRFIYANNENLYNSKDNPFLKNGITYNYFKKNNLLSSFKDNNKPTTSNKSKLIKKINFVLELTHKLIGFDKYHRLINLGVYLSDKKNHLFSICNLNK